MRVNAMNYIKPSVVLMGAILASNVVAADISDRFAVHGYGFQNYLQSTGGNTYLGADKLGDWTNNFLGVVVSTKIDDKSVLWAQLETSSAGTTKFTWFFLDYQFTSNLRGHVGRVKMPLGLYNEVIDAEMLQTTALVPSIYEAAADMVHDAYNGVGLDYEHDLGGGLIKWQLWGGNAQDDAPPESSRDRQVMGFRVAYETPIEGLKFMYSGYRTRVELLSPDNPQVLANNDKINEDRSIVSIVYETDLFDFKTEYAHHRFDVTGDGFYAELGYHLSDKWSPYIRYDSVTLDKTQKNDPSNYQKATVLGIDYKVSSNIGLRLENHFNHGYGLPVASEEVVAGTGKINWNLMVASVYFSF